MGTRVVHRRDHQGGSPVAGGTNLQEAQGVRYDRGVGHVIGPEFLGEPGVRVVDGVATVLHLDQGEVLSCRTMEFHTSTGVEAEVHRVGGPHQMKTKPVRVVRAAALIGRQEPVRGGVGADHQCHVTDPGKNLSPSHGQGRRSGGARRVRTRDLGSSEPECPSERRPGDVARVAAAHGNRTRDEADLPPVEVGVVESGPGRVDAVIGEVTAPFPPRVHSHTEDGDLVHVEYPLSLLRRPGATARSGTGCRRPRRAFPAPVLPPSPPTGHRRSRGVPPGLGPPSTPPPIPPRRW